MEYKQSTIDEIVESEKLMVLDAVERYPAHYPYALEAVLFLSNCVKSINKDRWVFGMFLSQVKKHLLLALFSTVRLHRIQAMMDLRQVLEAGACAAFSLATRISLMSMRTAYSIRHRRLPRSGMRGLTKNIPTAQRQLSA
ncbi:MAG TPA: hypothetical protein VLB11_01365 [Methyloceanibacter sp.]|nr:hypothetical protein [Methyloceanibacter sp.]